MKYVVAVSGGVDSVALLDMLVKKNEHELIVAHFDHGIRPDSNDDARFVEGLAQSYNLPFEIGYGSLGPAASEEKARNQRYAFLRAVAKKHDAMIVTAHHRDDIVETIAINLHRGTGWRGLAVMNDSSIHRPLLTYSKCELRDYVLGHHLEWVEDYTNTTNDYLRNIVRKRTVSLPNDVIDQLLTLRLKQCELAKLIDSETKTLLSSSRYFMTMIDEASALEILRHQLLPNVSLTRPQRRRLLHAIRTAQPNSVYEAGSAVTVRFTRQEFIVKHPL